MICKDFLILPALLLRYKRLDIKRAAHLVFNTYIYYTECSVYASKRMHTANQVSEIIYFR